MANSINKSEGRRGRVAKEFLNKDIADGFQGSNFSPPCRKVCKDQGRDCLMEAMGIGVVLNPGLTFLTAGELVTSITIQASLRPTESKYLGLWPGHQAF